MVIRKLPTASDTRLGWRSCALSQVSSLDTSVWTWSNVWTKARPSSWRPRSRAICISLPVAAFSAPCSTRRPLRLESTTSAGWPRLAQVARSGGYSCSVVAFPNHAPPPAGPLVLKAAPVVRNGAVAGAAAVFPHRLQPYAWMALVAHPHERVYSRTSLTTQPIAGQPASPLSSLPQSSTRP